MIGLLPLNIAVDPIFDPDIIENTSALSADEKAYLDSIGVPHDKQVNFKVPESAIKKCDQGIIKYLGREVEEKYGLSVGDWVLFSGYTGTTLRLEGEGLLIVMDGSHVVAKVEGEGVRSLDIDGLLFQDDEGQLWVPTYEMVMNLVAKACEEARLFTSRTVK